MKCWKCNRDIISNPQYWMEIAGEEIFFCDSCGLEAERIFNKYGLLFKIIPVVEVKP